MKFVEAVTHMYMSFRGTCERRRNERKKHESEKRVEMCKKTFLTYFG